jgi:hypothetical protein
VKKNKNRPLKPPVKNGGRKKFKTLLRRMSFMERMEPVCAELKLILHGSEDAADHKKLPDYCYNILKVFKRTCFKILPTLPETVSCDKERLASCKTLDRLSVTELIGSLKVVPYPDGLLTNSFSGVCGYVYRDGNLMIIREIKSRSKIELAVLPGLANDTVAIWTGPQGSVTTSGQTALNLDAEEAQPTSVVPTRDELLAFDAPLFRSLAFQ